MIYSSSNAKFKINKAVSSVPFLLPIAQTSLVFEALILQTTPPEPPDGNETRLRINSPIH